MKATRLLVLFVGGAIICVPGCDNQDQAQDTIPRQQPSQSAPDAPEVSESDLQMAEPKATAIELQREPEPTESPKTDPPHGGEGQKLKTAAVTSELRADDALDELDTSTPAAIAKLSETHSPSQEHLQEARSLLQQVRQYLADHKMELAEKGLDQLEQMKPLLPESLQQQIASLQELFNTTKAAADVQENLQGLMK